MSVDSEICCCLGNPEQAYDDHTSDLSYEESPNGTIRFDEKNEAKFQVRLTRVEV